MKSKRAWTADIIPNANKLRRIHSHLPIHAKALFLTLSSGGMRIGDCVRIELIDLQLHQQLVDGTIYHKIEVFDKKTDNQRFVFISDEAVESIEEWLKVREDYLVSSSKKCVPRPQYKNKFKGKSMIDNRLFPFTADNARCIWNRAIEKAGLDMRDKRTNRRKLHPHSLRKYYRTKMAGAGVPVDVVEALMGHEAYLDEYRKYSEDALVRFYVRGSNALSIFGDSGAVQSQLEAHRRAIKVLATIALRRIPREDLESQLIDKGVDLGLVDGGGGGKAIKSEWDSKQIQEILEIQEILKLLKIEEQS